MKRVLLSALATVGATIALGQCVAQAPARWTRHLNAECAWEDRGWTRAAAPLVTAGTDLAHMVGLDTRPPIVGPAEQSQLVACWRRRGWRGDPRGLSVVLTRWP